MKLGKIEHCDTIEKWLEIATGDLCDAAKARISREIMCHFEEALDVHLAEGRRLEESRTMALNDMGDPRVAAKRFRKEHITWGEQVRISALRADATKKRPSWRTPLELVILLCLIGWLPIIGQSYGAATLFFVLYAAAIYAVIWTPRFLVKIISPGSLAQWLLITDAVIQIATANASYLILRVLFSPVRFTFWLLVCYNVGTVIRIFQTVRILKKLRRHSFINNEPLPT